MIQKLLKVGSSTAVVIPKKSLAELGLKAGDDVQVEVNEREKLVTIGPEIRMTSEDKKIARLTLNFINRYRRDLEALAKK